MRSHACSALPIVMTDSGAIGGEGGGEGGRGGGGGVAGGEGGLGGWTIAMMARLTRRSAGALHARIWRDQGHDQDIFGLGRARSLSSCCSVRRLRLTSK